MAALGLSGVLAAIPMLATLGVVFSRSRQDATPIHGKSAYATKAEGKLSGIIYTKVPRNDSILLGMTKGVFGFGRRYLCLPGTGHAALYARTGAGKGVSFVVPACLAWEGSLIAFDIKGELYRLTAGQRARMGQDVFLFAPTAPDGKSHRYNPFSVVPRGEVGCIDSVQRIMHLLIPPAIKSDAAFWTNSARALAVAGAVILADTPGAPLNLASLLRMFTRSDCDVFIRGLVTRARNSQRPLPQVAVDVAMSWVNSGDPKTRQGIVEEMKSHLSLYASPQIVAATETSDFDLRDIRKQGMSIYIGATPDELRRLRPLMAVLFQQMISLNTQVEYDQDPAHTHRVLMMLDEFWAPGRMDMLADAAAFVRSYGIRMAYVVQTKAQIVSIYGPEGSENLFENTAAEVVFGVKGSRTAREVSELAGNDTVTDTSHSRPRFWAGMSPGKQSESERNSKRALLLPQEVQRLPADEQLVFMPHTQPLRTPRIVWYKDAWFNARKRTAPDVPTLHVHVAKDDGKAVV